MMKRHGFLIGTIVLCLPALLCAASAGKSLYDEGLDFYKAGRFSEATDAFERAVKKKDHATDAQGYIERIRRETVERIRNKALTGISKANWQSKFYYMNAVDNRVRVGISSQEMFERDSTNFRQGAVDALDQIARALKKADNARVDVELINEISQDPPQDPQVTALQQAAVFSYLSLATRDHLPHF